MKTNTIAFVMRWSFVLLALTVVGKLVYFNLSIGLPLGPKPGGILRLINFNLAVMTLITLIFPWRRGWIELAIGLIAGLIIQADLIYFRYYHDFPSVTMLTQVGSLGTLGSSLLSLWSPRDLLLFLDIPLWFAFRQRHEAYRFKRRYSALIIVPTFYFSSFHLPLFFSITTIFDQNYQPGLLRDYGIIHYHFQDVFQAAHSMIDRQHLPPETRNHLLSTYRNVTLPSNAFTGKFKGTNIIIVQMESIQQMVIGRSINGKPVTPHLNRLIGESYYFPNFYHQTGPGRTSDAEFLANNALFPLNKGVTFWQLRDNDFFALPHALSEVGYQTFSTHAFSETFYNRKNVHSKFGFSRSYFEADFIRDEIIGWGISDKSFFRQSLNLLIKSKQPYYAYMISLSCHYPFEGQFPTNSPIDLGSKQKSVIGRYLNAAHYADEAIGEFIESLRSDGILDNTIVVLYGDHNAIPYKDRDEVARFLDTRIDSLAWMDLQRVPLLIRFPEGKHQIVSRVGGQLDLAPTLANLVGIQHPLFSLIGRDLLDDSPGFVPFRDGSWLDDYYAYLAPSKERKDPEAYDRQSRQLIPPSLVTAGTNRAKQTLEVSDLITRKNLIPELRLDKHSNREFQ